MLAFRKTFVAAAALLGAQQQGASAARLQLLNAPDKKIETRINSLKSLRKKMEKMEMNGLLADQKPKLDAVVKKIDGVLSMDSKKSDEKVLDKAIKEVQSEVNDLKASLMKKAMDLQKEQEQLFKQHNAKKATEDVFDKLMNVQDAPLKEQLTVLAAAPSDDTFIAKFAKRPFKEGDNLAMLFGQALDTRVDDERREAEKTDLEALENSAHLTEEQAKGLLPILTKVKQQRAEKESKLKEVERKLAEMQETERFYKKHKAVLGREKEVLGKAISAIEHGKLKELTEAMEQMKKITV